MKPQNTSYNLSLSLGKSLATVAVVLLHATVPITTKFGVIPDLQWWIGNFYSSLTRWGVPLFLIYAGWLGLRNKNTSSLKNYFDYLKRRSLKIGLPLLFWILIYAVYYHWYRGDPLELEFVLGRIIYDQPYEHLYFLFILLAGAVFTPIIKKILEAVPTKTHFFIFLVLVGVNLWWPQSRFIFYFFIPYLSWFATGYLLRENQSALIKLLPIRIVSILLTVSLFITFMGTGLLSYYPGLFNDSLYLYNYFNPLTWITTLSLSVLLIHPQLINFFSKKLTKHIYSFEKTTFSIYLMHPIILNGWQYLYGLIAPYETTAIISIPMVTLLTVATCYWLSFKFRDLLKPLQKG